MSEGKKTGLAKVPQDRSMSVLPELPVPLPARAQHYRELGVQGSANTQRGYAADLRSYEAYCETLQLVPYPAELNTLAGYLTHLADSNRKLATVYRHLAAIEKKHTLLGFKSEAENPILEQILSGITRDLGKEQRQAPAFTIDHLKSCVARLDLTTTAGLRDRALLLVGFAGAFRRSELASLNIEHVTFDGEILLIKMGRSKTNQAGEVQQKALFRGKESLYCPVQAYEDWVAQLGRTQGPVFVSIAKGKTAGTGKPSAKRLSTNSINTLVGKHLGEFAKGVPYTAHSFRSSFITIAKLAGRSNESIRNQTLHKTDEILRRYTRLNDVKKINAADNMGL